MSGEAESIILPESLHNAIQDFFLRTSLPRIRKEMEKEAQKEESPTGNKR